MEKLVMKNIIRRVHDVEVQWFKYALVYVNVCMHIRLCVLGMSRIMR